MQHTLCALVSMLLPSMLLFLSDRKVVLQYPLTLVSTVYKNQLFPRVIIRPSHPCTRPIIYQSFRVSLSVLIYVLLQLSNPALIWSDDRTLPCPSWRRSLHVANVRTPNPYLSDVSQMCIFQPHTRHPRS